MGGYWEKEFPNLKETEITKTTVHDPKAEIYYHINFENFKTQ